MGKDTDKEFPPLRIATWNANGIQTRKTELELFLAEFDVGVCMVTETFLKPGVAFALSGYRSYRRDREGGPGGGVAVFFRASITAEKVSLATAIEAIGLRTKIDGRTHVFVAVYNPPSTSLSTTDFDTIFAEPGTIIGGDLNAKDPAWGSRLTNPVGRQLRQIVCARPLVRVYGPEDATHIPEDFRKCGDVLDIFLTFDCEELREVHTVHRLSSDHFPVLAEYGSVEARVVLKGKVNWISFAWHASQIVCPEDPLLPNEIDTEAERVTTVIQDALRVSQSMVAPNRHNRLGLTWEEKALVRAKNQMKVKWSKHRDPRDKAALNRLQAQVKAMLRSKQEEEWRTSIDKANENDSNFWRLLQKLKRRKDPNAPIRLEARTLFEDQEKAEATADFFSKQFSNHLVSTASTVLQVEDSKECLQRTPLLGTSPAVSLEEVQKKLQILAWRKAPGIDEIPNKALRLLPRPAVICLVRLINAVLKHAVFPTIWQRAVLITIPKGRKDPTKLDNRRPISLLPGLAKLVESVIKDRIQDFAEEQGVFKVNQFGFRGKLGAVHKAAHLAAIVEANLRPRKRVIAVMLDVAKAYDRVWRDGLLHKMVSFGFPWNLCQLVRSWLSNRRFQARVGKCLSSVRVAQEGLPQGSALSPVLFNVFVADMPCFPRDRFLTTLQFADDTALVAIGPTMDATKNRMEKGLKEISTYVKKWKIELNPNKTEAILFGRKRPAENYISFEGSKVKFRPSATYLGVTFDRSMRFEKHARSRKFAAENRLRPLFSLTQPESRLGLRSRLQIANSVAIPAAVYGQEVWVTGSLKAAAILKTAQNKIYRRTLGAPWYIRNEEIRDEVGAEDLRETAWKRRRRMIEALKSHPNKDVAETGDFIEEVGPLG